MDDRFYNGASPGFVLGELRGNEDIELIHLTDRGRLFFRLPGDWPWVTLDRGRGPEVVPVRIDTCRIEVEDLRVHLVWRGHLAYGGHEELASYPFIRLDVLGTTLAEARDKLGETAREDTGTLILSQADIAKAAEARQPETGRTGPRYEWTIGDDEGTHQEALSRDGRVLQADDAWIERAKAGFADEDNAKARAAREAAREQRREGLAALRKRIAEIEEQEAKAAAAAKKKN
jgi:hypothetical protein